MKEYQSLIHARWDCKYHVVFIPKKRQKRIFGEIWRHLGVLGCVQKVGGARRGGAHRRPSDGGSCPHVFEHSAEVCRLTGGGLHQKGRARSRSRNRRDRDALGYSAFFRHLSLGSLLASMSGVGRRRYV